MEKFWEHQKTAKTSKLFCLETVMVYDSTHELIPDWYAVLAQIPVVSKSVGIDKNPNKYRLLATYVEYVAK